LWKRPKELLSLEYERCAQISCKASLIAALGEEASNLFVMYANGKRVEIVEIVGKSRHPLKAPQLDHPADVSFLKVFRRKGEMLSIISGSIAGSLRMHLFESKESVIVCTLETKGSNVVFLMLDFHLWEAKLLLLHLKGCFCGTIGATFQQYNPFFLAVENILACRFCHQDQLTPLFLQ
jgi:hypothetical protein